MAEQGPQEPTAETPPVLARQLVTSPSSYCGGKGQEGVPAWAAATSLCGCRSDLTGRHSGTYSFCCLAPRQVQANTIAGVPLLLLHVLEIPQVTVCPGISGEGEGSRKFQSWPPQPCPPGTPKASTHGPSLGMCWEMGITGKHRWCMDRPWPAPKQLWGSGSKHPGQRCPPWTQGYSFHPPFPGCPKSLCCQWGPQSQHCTHPV